MDELKRRNTLSAFLLIVVTICMVGLQVWLGSLTSPKVVSYSELTNAIAQDRIAEVQIDDERVFAKQKTKQKGKLETLVAERIPHHSADDLVRLLNEHHVPFRGHERDSWPVLAWLVPLGILVLLMSVGARRAVRQGPMSFGRSKVKIYDRTDNSHVTFEDVAGVDEAEAELVEVVDFLKHPQKYRAIGARIPKGVLLLGPPGTGKTLLARAVAGEAEVPFFSISGSEFVEMFVGVGAARVRDMFEQAKQRSPCIVFVDELDAIGRSRGGLATMSSNDEREQTLNQLLVEMDGFDPSTAVVIMAATNRPEILDAALVRPGRFDRQVLVDRPDLRGRREILAVHVRKLAMSADVNLDVIAQRTPGLVGADLANLVNEAALAAARRGSHEVAQTDLEEAIDRIQLGLKKKNRVMDSEEKRRVAFHESGHALVAMSLRNADPVHRVTIIPRSVGALGATLQVPTQERYLLTLEQLRDRLCVLFGGRAAEDLITGSPSTGAQNDFEQAAEIARQMVCRFGMSERLGLLTYGKTSQLRFLDVPGAGVSERNYSEETARVIDEEVKRIVDMEYARARALLSEQEPSLRAIAQRLLEVETLEGKDLADLVAATQQRASSGKKDGERGGLKCINHTAREPTSRGP
jgi:cell division protease FtsH